MNYAGLLGEIAATAATDAVAAARRGDIRSLGEAQDAVGSAMTSFLNQYGGSLAAQLTAIAEPAAQKAVETIKPALLEALKEYTPVAASVFGGIVALSIILGVWIARRT